MNHRFLSWARLLALLYALSAALFLLLFVIACYGFVQEWIQGTVLYAGAPTVFETVAAVVELLLVTSLGIGIGTQLAMARALWRRSSRVRLLSRFDILAGIGRAFILLFLGRELLRVLPWYFFISDSCACDSFRTAQYIPLDPYYHLIKWTATIVLIVVASLLPAWYFNFSKRARRSFTRE